MKNNPYLGFGIVQYDHLMWFCWRVNIDFESLESLSLPTSTTTIEFRPPSMTSFGLSLVPFTTPEVHRPHSRYNHAEGSSVTTHSLFPLPLTGKVKLRVRTHLVNRKASTFFFSSNYSDEAPHETGD